MDYSQLLTLIGFLLFVVTFIGYLWVRDIRDKVRRHERQIDIHEGMWRHCKHMLDVLLPKPIAKQPQPSPPIPNGPQWPEPGKPAVLTDADKELEATYESLKAWNTKNAMRGYIHNGVIQLIHSSGLPIHGLVDVSVDQPIKAARGKEPTMATITVMLNLYDTKDAAMSVREVPPESNTSNGSDDDGIGVGDFVCELKPSPEDEGKTYSVVDLTPSWARITWSNGLLSTDKRVDRRSVIKVKPRDRVIVDTSQPERRL